MTIGEFLSDRLDRLLIQVICIALAVLFLKATGTQSGILIILILALVPVLGALQLFDFFRQRIRLRELEAILEGLDQKYLFAECVPPPKSLY